MEAVLRARTLSETHGFMKALLDHNESDEILGFTAVGPHAGEILAVVQTAMMEKLPYTLLRDAVFTHPTMAEGLGPLFSGRPGHGSAAVPIQSPEIGGLRGAGSILLFLPAEHPINLRTPRV